MSPLLSFRRNTSRVSPAPACMRRNDLSKKDTNNKASRKGIRDPSSMTKTVDQLSDADCIIRAKSWESGFTRRHGLGESQMQEDIQTLRWKLLKQALSDTNMI